jgi:hypothetical protein
MEHRCRHHCCLEGCRKKILLVVVGQGVTVVVPTVVVPTVVVLTVVVLLIVVRCHLRHHHRVHSVAAYFRRRP